MKLFKFLGTAIVSGLLLAACGGGNSLTQSTGTTGGGATSTVAKVTVSASPATIAADGSTTSTITAVAADENNNLVQGATVTFTSSAGGIAVVSGTTDSSGSATATLSANGAAAGTQITVTASAGTGSGMTTVGVVAIQQTITLLTNQSQVPSNSSKSATISALLKDANNNVLPGVVLTFSSTSGSITPTATVAGAAVMPAVPAGTTDANGVAEALVNAGNDFTNRTITVTVSTPTASATIPVNVTGTTLALAGPANLVLGNQGSYTVTLADSSGTGIPNQSVGIADKAGNSLSATSVTTNSTGQATVTLTASTSATSDTLSATALGLGAEQAIAISTQSFQITTPSGTTTEVDLGANQTIAATWTNGGNPVSGQIVTFSTTRGVLNSSTATTNGSGVASVTISSADAGPAIVQASGTGVSATVPIDFVATDPTQISVQASPSAVTTQGTSTITATVRDPADNLVQNAVVNFTLVDITNGTLSQASATTDVQGQAQVTYTAGNSTSPSNGVVVTGTVAGTNPVVSGTATLTVGGQTVNLSLGTGNQIGFNSQHTQYSQQYEIQAIDTQGAPVPNVPIVVSILPVSYWKGTLQWDYVTPPATIGCGDIWCTAYSIPAPCPNEDIDYTGVYEVSEDFNNNGKLDPGFVASVTPSSGTTDATGTLLVEVTYPADHANWVTEKLIATATVSGTESSTSITFLLEGLAADYTTQTTAPPGQVSPYGQANSCANPN
jgi:hypothetical protein